MARRPRLDHSPAFKAKVEVAAIRYLRSNQNRALTSGMAQSRCRASHESPDTSQPGHSPAPTTRMSPGCPYSGTRRLRRQTAEIIILDKSDVGERVTPDKAMDILRPSLPHSEIRTSCLSPILDRTLKWRGNVQGNCR